MCSRSSLLSHYWLMINFKNTFSYNSQSDECIAIFSPYWLFGRWRNESVDAIWSAHSCAYLFIDSSYFNDGDLCICRYLLCFNSALNCKLSIDIHSYYQFSKFVHIENRWRRWRIDIWFTRSISHVYFVLSRQILFKRPIVAQTFLYNIWSSRSLSIHEHKLILCENRWRWNDFAVDKLTCRWYVKRWCIVFHMLSSISTIHTFRRLIFLC